MKNVGRDGSCGKELPTKVPTLHLDITVALPCLALRCLGLLAPRRAVGARHDGLPRQFSPLLPIVCHGLSLSEGFAGPLRDVVYPALFRTVPSSTAFDCSL